eukprot:492925-Pyramimonas_sp.AAC.1
MEALLPVARRPVAGRCPFEHFTAMALLPASVGLLRRRSLRVKVGARGNRCRVTSCRLRYACS